MNTIGERIKFLMQERDLRQKDLAEKMNVSPAAIYYMTNDKTFPSNTSIALLCQIFDVNEEWLRTGEGDIYNPIGRSESIAKVATELFHDASDEKVKFIRLMSQLNEEQIKTLTDVALKIAEYWNEGC